jgi:HSP90 family molecular chaperone
LTDKNFDFAYKKIKEILKKYNKLKKEKINDIKKLDKKLKKLKKIVDYFKKYLQFIDKNFNGKISNEDTYKIYLFHQLGYLDQIEQVMRQTKAEMERFNNYIQNLNHYNENVLKIVKRYEEKNSVNINNLNLHYEKLKSDFVILKKVYSYLL